MLGEDREDLSGLPFGYLVVLNNAVQNSLHNLGETKSLD
jgi:hypothetical protein